MNTNLNIHHGDLLQSDCTVIAHQANCFSTMRAGIAKQIASAYPQAYEADRNLPLSPAERLGKISYAYIREKPIVVFNLYGQFRYGRNGRYTDYPALRSALTLMFQALTRGAALFTTIPLKVGMPYGMGADRAGGDFSIISSMVEELAAVYDIPVTWYKFQP